MYVLPLLQTQRLTTDAVDAVQLLLSFIAGDKRSPQS